MAVPSKKKVGPLGWLLRAAALAYPLALLAVALLVRLVGERWWVTASAMYLPLGVGLALPLAVLVPALAIWGPRWLLAAQAASVVVLLFPLLGLQASLSRAPSPGAPALRLVSFNVAAGVFKEAPIVAAAVAAKPDVVIFQESTEEADAALAAALPGFSCRRDDEFMIASRFPIRDAEARLPAFVRYRLDTPSGPVQLFNVHFTSPHRVLEKLRGEGVRRELATGRALHPKAAPQIATNALLRAGEAQAVADEAAGAAPEQAVIVAGDTNLPSLSWALARAFGRYQDAFATAGSGFGYTYPATKRPWLRVDRVLADDHFRVVRFEVLPQRVSDHLGVAAELEWTAAKAETKAAP